MAGWWFVAINFIFPYIGNNHPNWLSYFSEGFKPPTRWLWNNKRQKISARSRAVIPWFLIIVQKTAIFLWLEWLELEIWAIVSTIPKFTINGRLMALGFPHSSGLHSKKSMILLVIDTHFLYQNFQHHWPSLFLGFPRCLWLSYPVNDENHQS